MAALLLLMATACSWADTGFVIKNFHSNIEILPDATMSIVETIDVEFLESKRGIYREIPFRYVDKRGLQRLIDIYGVSVRGETTKVTNQGSNVNIRIGDADFFLPAGTKKSYVISYRVAGGLNFFDKDSQWEPWTELYWNLTGHYWPVPIERSSFQIRFPRSSGGEGLRVRGYFGPTFSTNGTPELTKLGTVTDPTGAMRITLTEDTVSGVYDQYMDAYAGTTIVLGLPQTLVPKPPPIAAFKRWLKTYWLIFLPIPIGLILFLRWMAVGRDPKIGPVGVRFEPPVGVDASFAGVLIDDKVDARDISAGNRQSRCEGLFEICDGGQARQVPGHLKRTCAQQPSRIRVIFTTYEKKLLQALKPPFEKLKIKSLSTRLKPEY
ncbi:DUF2207 domain-containing protein [Geitlerinema splendidum]|nr:DUF2207 domain-containing protein [Geitlerinema splendidum]